MTKVSDEEEYNSHKCAPISELPSNISTMMLGTPEWLLEICKYLLQLCSLSFSSILDTDYSRGIYTETEMILRERNGKKAFLIP